MFCLLVKCNETNIFNVVNAVSRHRDAAVIKNMFVANSCYLRLAIEPVAGIEFHIIT